MTPFTYPPPLGPVICTGFQISSEPTRRMLRLALSAACALSLAAAGLAQASPPGAAASDEPVTWNFTIGAGCDAFAVLAEAQVADGWYIYSQFLDDGGPIPTELDLSPTPGAEPVGEPTEGGDRLSGVDEMFGMEVTKFKRNARFTQAFDVPDDVRTLRGGVRFMACTDKKCLPPRTVDFELALREE